MKLIKLLCLCLLFSITLQAKETESKKGTLKVGASAGMNYLANYSFGVISTVDFVYNRHMLSVGGYFPDGRDWSGDHFVVPLRENYIPDRAGISVKYRYTPKYGYQGIHPYFIFEHWELSSKTLSQTFQTDWNKFRTVKGGKNQDHIFQYIGFGLAYDVSSNFEMFSSMAFGNEWLFYKFNSNDKYPHGEEATSMKFNFGIRYLLHLN